MTESRPKPVVLCILDGWGHRVECEDNAICQADTPNWDRFLAERPHALLDASEHEVGLPDGQMGNSEVGHMNIGAGRVVLQDLPRIDAALEDGSLAENPALRDFIGTLKASGGTAHLVGLLSPGGVHSHQRHIAALARAISEAGVPVAVHALLDGRDTPPRSALDYLAEFERAIAGADGVAVATVGGRYWGMDRDQRWERIERAYDAMVDGKGERAESARAAVEAGYERGENDEFVAPTAIDDYGGMADGDGVLMANFRADRARQILTALLDPAFDGFERGRAVDFAAALGTVEYSEALAELLPAMFPPETIAHTLGETVAEAGLAQLRIAETEKYAHVTFFLNGGRETQFEGEERILIPSPKVATYDLQPEMSAPEVTDRLVEAVGSGRFDLIVVNYANGDMVGHTGDLDAARQAAEAVETAGGALVVTADHGNAETMRDPNTGQAHTAHTMNLVPLILAVDGAGAGGLEDGRLADVAPTVLALMGLPQPREMTGRSLLTPAPAREEASRARA